MAWGKIESLSWSSSIQKYEELLLQGRESILRKQIRFPLLNLWKIKTSCIVLILSFLSPKSIVQVCLFVCPNCSCPRKQKQQEINAYEQKNELSFVLFLNALQTAKRNLAPSFFLFFFFFMYTLLFVVEKKKEI